MAIEQYTYWSMTLNNPDENDWVLVRNPNDKYVRQLIHTREVGAETGTEHIQAWVRLQRNQTRAFMRKLWPKGHFQPIKKDEYNENCIAYSQKNDDTTGGHHVNTINDPLPANDTLLYQVLEKALEELVQSDSEFGNLYATQREDMVWHKRFTLAHLETVAIERSMVMERTGLEKIFCSPAYEKMKVRFFREIIYRIIKAQTRDAEGRENDETTQQESTIEDSSCDGDSEDNEDSSSEADEGHSEGTGSSFDEEDD